MTAQTSLPGVDIPNAQHSIESSEWYSPDDLVVPARKAMGGFDLDPASCEAANKQIGATKIYTVETDGLSHDWDGSTFLNPPNPPRPWWDKLIRAHLDRRVPTALYVAYSLEQIQQSQRWEASMLAFPTCIPNHRIPYLCTAADAIEKLKKRVRSRLERERRKLAAARTPGAGALHGSDQNNDVEVVEGFQGWGRAEVKRLGELERMDPSDLVKGDQPPHASAIVGVGWDFEVFRAAYGSLGEVVGGRRRAA